MENNKHEKTETGKLLRLHLPNRYETKTCGIFGEYLNPLGEGLNCLLFALLILFIGPTNACGGSATGQTPSGSEQVLKEFYHALSMKDCSRALALRPDYSIEKCMDTDWVNISQIKQIAKTPRIALVYIKISYSRHHQERQWTGHTMLIYAGKSWKIQDDRFWWDETKFSLEYCLEKVAKFESPASSSRDGSKRELNRPMETGSEAAVNESQNRPPPGVALRSVPHESQLETDSEGLIEDVETLDQSRMPQGVVSASAAQRRPPVPGRDSLQKEFNIKNPEPAGPEPIIEGFTFGSEIILHKLWTSQQLNGTPDDKKIQSLAKPDHSAPDLQVPRVKNQPLVPCLMNSIRSVKPFRGRKVIALTFDLCETANDISGYDAAIVNYLREHKIKATFFAGGKWMLSHPDKTEQLMADPLFEIGNHTWSHANLRVANDKDTVKEILWTQAQYELLWEDLERRCKALGIDSEMSNIPRLPMVFRFPYGTCSQASLSTLSRLGLAAIQWDVVSGDPTARQTAENITRTILNQTKPGSIIICHANGRGHGTAEALPKFISELRNRGFEFVTVSELLRLGQVEAYEECFELRPGDNSRYDRVR